MQFADVIGQETVKQQLKNLLHQNRLGHALLFLGKEGNGSLPLALALSQYLVCEKTQTPPSQEPSLFGEAATNNTPAQPAEDSCGICSACIKARDWAHPDIHFSFPTVVTKSIKKPIARDFLKEWRSFLTATPYGNLFDWTEQIKENENSQGNITAEECNDIIRQLSLKSFESPYKILILWMPERLGTAGNKLLKLIEEPPPDTLIILVAENEGRILPTIISRCQLIKIPALPAAQIEKALVQRENLAPETARQLAAIAEGNYREALAAIQHAADDWQALLRDWLNAMMKTGPIAQTRWVEEMNQLGREKQKQFLRYFNHLLEEAIHLRIATLNPSEGGTLKKSSNSKNLYNISDSERGFTEKINKKIGIEQQQAIIEELDRASYYIERNANSKLLFHALTIKLNHIIRDKVVFLE